MHFFLDQTVEYLDWEVTRCTVHDLCIKYGTEHFFVQERVLKVIVHLAYSVIQVNDHIVVHEVAADHWLWKSCDWFWEVVQTKHFRNVDVVELFAFIVYPADFLDAVILIGHRKVCAYLVLLNKVHLDIGALKCLDMISPERFHVVKLHLIVRIFIVSGDSHALSHFCLRVG